MILPPKDAYRSRNAMESSYLSKRPTLTPSVYNGATPGTFSTRPLTTGLTSSVTRRALSCNWSQNSIKKMRIYALPSARRCKNRFRDPLHTPSAWNSAIKTRSFSNTVGRIARTLARMASHITTLTGRTTCVCRRTTAQSSRI